MGYYIPALDDFGDDALPLDKLLHRNRHYHPLILPLAQPPLLELDRERMLRAHCSKRGKRHEFVVQTREGAACLWCGMVPTRTRVEAQA